MAKSVLPPVQLQVGRVHRRMKLQSVLNMVLWSWTISLGTAAGWFLVQPYALPDAADWVRWVMAGSLFGLATIAGAVIGYLRAPGRLTAALSLDHEFGLKERVTTSLTLAAAQAESAAGMALLQDANQRVKDLVVAEKFPLRLKWSAAFVPATAILLACLGLFYNPVQSQAKSKLIDEGKQPPDNAALIEQKMKELAKKPPQEKPATDRAKPEDLKRLEAELEQIANRPRSNKDEIKERIAEMTELKDKMDSRSREMAEKAKALKDQLRKLDSLSQKDSSPAKDLEKALSEGKFDKARDEVDKLKQRLQSGQLSQKELEQLQKQLEKMKDKLNELAQQEKKLEELKKANLDPETLKREMDKLKRDQQKLGDLKELAEKLGKCQEALKDGEMQLAKDALNEAAEKMKGMQGEEEDLADLRDQLKRLQDAKDSC